MEDIDFDKLLYNKKRTTIEMVSGQIEFKQKETQKNGRWEVNFTWWAWWKFKVDLHIVDEAWNKEQLPTCCYKHEEAIGSLKDGEAFWKKVSDAGWTAHGAGCFRNSFLSMCAAFDTGHEVISINSS